MLTKPAPGAYFVKRGMTGSSEFGYRPTHSSHQEGYLGQVWPRFRLVLKGATFLRYVCFVCFSEGGGRSSPILYTKASSTLVGHYLGEQSKFITPDRRPTRLSTKRRPFQGAADIHLNVEPLDPTSCKPVVNHGWIAEVGRRFVTLGVSYPIDPTDKKPTVVTGCHSLSRLSRLVTVCHACGRATRSTRSMRSPFHLVHLFHIVSENRHFNCKREIRALG